MSFEMPSLVTNISTMRFKALLFTLGILFLFTACQEGTSIRLNTNDKTSNEMILSVAKDSPQLPKWAAKANIYEVNIRQYTPEGTFNAFAKHLPRLKEMGVEILWLMPVFPISDTKKKGKLGSYYAVSDFKQLNPAYGTEDDFRALINQVHQLDMKIILDWVPNHTGWDHNWIKEHRDWYTRHPETDTILHPRGEDGNPTDWYDVADLNYESEALREAMIKALEYWVKDFDVDGYRMDMAMLVPADFWELASKRLRQLKEVFLLAESEDPVHRNRAYFNMDYGWTFHHLMNDIARGEKRADALTAYFQKDNKRYNKGFHMYFTSNHDENAWAGTVFERMGDSHKTFAVLAATLDGMPLLYGGQEAPLKKRLQFFDKDEIEWGEYEYARFYKKLLELKKRNKSLWNGSYGGDLQQIPTGNIDIFAFTREKDGDRVIVFLNFSELPQEIAFSDAAFSGDYMSVFDNTTMTLAEEASMKLNPWSFIVLSNR